jgi:hypothetical protein
MSYVYVDDAEARHFRFLDQLQLDGSINMFGAATPLAEMFDLPTREARAVLQKWMDTWSARHER